MAAPLNMVFPKKGSLFTRVTEQRMGSEETCRVPWLRRGVDGQFGPKLEAGTRSAGPRPGWRCERRRPSRREAIRQLSHLLKFQVDEG